MERYDNNNRSQDASKGDVCEISDGVVTNEPSSDKQKAGDTKNEESKENIVKNGQIPVDNGKVVEKIENVKKGNGENKTDIPKTPVTEKTPSSDREEIKSDVKTGTAKSDAVMETPDAKVVNEDTKSSDRKSNETSADKSNVVVIQKPKRTKSRKSLNRMYSVNNIDVDINGNATIQRTDR